MLKRLLIICAFALCACSSDSAPPAVDGSSDSSAGAFGATCNTVSDTSTECASGVCTDSFNQLGHVCSQKCNVLNGTDPSCPNGSMGQKCNMKGYCRP